MKKTFTEKEKSEYIFILDLIAYSFGNRRIFSVPENIDWKSVFVFSQHHSISNIISYAIDSLKIPVPDDAKHVFTSERKFALMKDTSQFSATQKLLTAFEKNGVDNLPVKGQFIKDTYPQPDYRITCDVDIHLRRPDLQRAKEISNSMGFKTTFQSQDLAVVCSEPFVEFELHADNGEFADTTFSDDLFISAVLKSGTSHCYEFPLEEHYIYIVEHYAKHYRDLSGMGLRMIMDMYCLYSYYKDKLDFKKVNARLKKAGVYKFHKMLIKKGEDYFSGSLKCEFDPVDIFLLANGFMGDIEIYTYNYRRHSDSFDGDQSSYIFRKFFPKYKLMKQYYPVLKKCPVLLPGAWVYRWGDVVLGKSRKTHIENIKYLKKYSNSSDRDYLIDIMRKSGFDMKR